MSALMILASLWFKDARITGGTAAGCALALLNFKWLHVSTKAILSSGAEKAPPGATLKFVFRWIVIGAVVYVAYDTGLVSVVAMLIALLVPGVAAMIEAAYVTYRALKGDLQR